MARPRDKQDNELAGLREEIARLRESETALRIMVATLSREEYLLRTLLDTMPDNIYFKDTQSRFIRINQATAKWFALEDPSEAEGKTDADMFTAEHASRALEDERRIISTGQPLIGIEEKETWPTGGETWVSTTKVPLRNANREIVGTCGISRDITRQKRVEVERERLLGELQQAMEKIRTLQGLIPICPECKRIRDDKGYWRQVEAYIGEHSGATFSHSLCEECSRKLYPGYAGPPATDAREGDQPK